MTRRRATLAAASLIVIAIVLWQRSTTSVSPAPVADNASGLSPRVAPSPPPRTPNPKPQTAGEARSPLADALNSPATDIHADLRLVSEIVATFRTNFLRDGNPVGSNAEITAALAGKNKLQLALIPPDHPAINQEGELCDRWGTPFFFHAESATRMEIRSAGPDKKMWSADDVAFSP